MNGIKKIFVSKKTPTYVYVHDDCDETSDGLITELISDDSNLDMTNGKIQIQDEIANNVISDEQIQVKFKETQTRIKGTNNETSAKRNKCLLILCGVVISLLSLLILLISVQNHKKSEKNVCLSSSCVHVSDRIITKMNLSADPCDDFYSFACGGWINKNLEIPQNLERVNLFSKMESDKKKTIKRILETESNPKTAFEISARQLYKKCLNETEINILGAKPLLLYLQDLSIGNIPVIKVNINKTITLDEVLLNVTLKNIFPFFEIYQTVNPNNSKQYILNVEQPRFLYLKEIINTNDKEKNEQMKNDRITYMKSIFELLGSKLNETDLKWHIDQIIRLETDLLDISIGISQVKTQTTATSCYPLHIFKNGTNSLIKWSYLIKTYYKVEADVKISDSQVVCTDSINYLSKLGNVFKNTTKETINNYIIWFTIDKYIGFLNSSFVKAKSKIERDTFGVDKSCNERWMTCVEYTTDVFYLVISKLFVHKKFGNQSKTYMENVVNDIKKTFLENLSNAEWMNKSIKSKAAEKARYMHANVGYSKKTLKNSFLNLYYKEISEKIMEENFFNIMIKSELIRARYKMKNFKKPVDSENQEWMININAYFAPTENSIYLPAGILQPPLFSYEQPFYINYGGIGVAVGHELTHGFDNNGVKYDKLGNKRNWWNNQTQSNFNDKAKCMIDQYNKFKFGNYSINGKMTIGENIADNGGLRLAYQAFKKQQSKLKEEKSLPGLDFTADQLFFISAAQTWCSVVRKKSLINQILTNEHTPAKYRVHGMLQNFDMFSKVFTCKKGSKMNPNRKCRVW